MIQTIILFVAVLLLSFCVYGIISDIIKAINYNTNRNYNLSDNYFITISIITAVCLTYIIWYCN